MCCVRSRCTITLRFGCFMPPLYLYLFKENTRQISQTCGSVMASSRRNRPSSSNRDSLNRGHDVKQGAMYVYRDERIVLRYLTRMRRSITSTRHLNKEGADKILSNMIPAYLVHHFSGHEQFKSSQNPESMQGRSYASPAGSHRRSK